MTACGEERLVSTGGCVHAHGMSASVYTLMYKSMCVYTRVCVCVCKVIYMQIDVKSQPKEDTLSVHIHRHCQSTICVSLHSKQKAT